MKGEDLRYTQEHEWVRLEDDIATIGITDHAQSQLGDVVFVDLPEAGASFKRGEAFGAVESVKAASDCYCPVSGTVVEVNAALGEAPQKVNEDPFGQGWMVKIRIGDPSELDALLGADAYADLVAKSAEQESAGEKKE